MKKTWWQTVDKIKDANVVLFGIPYDKTASFQKGTVAGPAEFREKMEFSAETWSPYQNKELLDLKIFDAGDVKVDNKKKPMYMNEAVEKFTDKILEHNVKTVMIGGEHSVSYPVFKSHFKKNPDLHLIHFDAHTDLRDEFYDEPYSHACIVKKCIDLMGPGKAFQFGIRSGSKEEFELHDKGITYIEKSGVTTVPKIAKKLINKPVYITIDIDVLDPSIAPGTGTPEAGGISYEALIESLQHLSKIKNIVGIDLVELSPKCDLSNRTTALAVKLMREAILMIFGK